MRMNYRIEELPTLSVIGEKKIYATDKKHKKIFLCFRWNLMIVEKKINY